jgi:hypothetical protein
LFELQMKSLDTEVHNKLSKIETNVAAEAENGHGKLLNEQLRNITAAEGQAIYQIAREEGIDLDEYLLLQHAVGQIDDDDYHAAIAYLQGNRVQGARYEIKSSLGFWSDDKTRIETVMRNLTPDELEKLHTEGSDAIEAARGWWHLSGTDLEVFDALNAGQPARADAIRAIDKVDRAKRSGDYDELNASLTTAFSTTNYGQKQVSADEHRKDVQREMASILRARDLLQTGVIDPALDDQTVVKNFVTEQVEVPVGDDMGMATTITLQIDGANKDLAIALITDGPDSRAVKTAQLGVEAQRPDGPTVLKVDKALVDERLKPVSPLDEDGKQNQGDAGQGRGRPQEGAGRARCDHRRFR